MIRLRYMLQRGLAHPVLGPLVLLALALLLSMVFLHVSDDAHALGELGAVCVGLTSVLGALLIARSHGLVGSLPAPVRGDRWPPVTVPASVASGTDTSFSARSSPLRR